MLETSLQGFVGQYLDALAVGEDPIAARGIGLIIDRFAISVRRAHEAPRDSVSLAGLCPDGFQDRAFTAQFPHGFPVCAACQYVQPRMNSR